MNPEIVRPPMVVRPFSGTLRARRLCYRLCDGRLVGLLLGRLRDRSAGDEPVARENDDNRVVAIGEHR